MTRMYMTGYNGTVRTLDQLKAWSQWQSLDPEMQRRVLALMDASIDAGRPLGVGNIFRSFQQQEAGFLSRHHVVASGGCCTYNGKRYALNAGVAHMAPPGRSYHEATTRLGRALAIDFIGNMQFLAANCDKYGLNEFSQVNQEPWHSQPKELPKSRSQYVVATMDPLKPATLPAPPAPAPTKVTAPKPTIRQGAVNDSVQVRALQLQCNFWGWRDMNNRTVLVDGVFGERSAQAVMAMQRALGQAVDGVYGPVTAGAFQKFLDGMTARP